MLFVLLLFLMSLFQERQQQELEESLQMMDELKSVLAAKEANSVLKSAKSAAPFRPASTEEPGPSVIRPTTVSNDNQDSAEPLSVAAELEQQGSLGKPCSAHSLQDDEDVLGGSGRPVPPVSQLALAAAIRARQSITIATVEYGSSGEDDDSAVS